MPDEVGRRRARKPPWSAIFFTVLAVANLVLLVVTRHAFNAALAITWGMGAAWRWVRWSGERD